MKLYEAIFLEVIGVTDSCYIGNHIDTSKRLTAVTTYQAMVRHELVKHGLLKHESKFIKRLQDGYAGYGEPQYVHQQWEVFSITAKGVQVAKEYTAKYKKELKVYGL